MARDTNFYYSFLVLPPAKRQAIIAVWDFCRAVDDAVDEVGEARRSLPSRSRAGGGKLRTASKAGRRRLGRAARWRRSSRSSASRAQPFESLIEGVEMDLATRRYETFDDLYQYCIRVASAVGLMCLEIFGYRNPASRQYAIDLGVALQLTNILRDVQGRSRARTHLHSAGGSPSARLLGRGPAA